MARRKIKTTRLDIIRCASHLFLEKGFSATSPSAICDILDIGTGNLTYYFPTKEHLLTVLTQMLCDFQWKIIEEEANEGVSSIMAICLELVTMAAACEQDAAAKDYFLATYTSPMTLDIIRKNDIDRAKQVFGQYCADWTDEQFMEAEVLVSGIEYATLQTTSTSAPLEARISGALSAILAIYHVPEELRKAKIQKALALDYRKLGARVLKEFRTYVDQTTEQALIDQRQGRKSQKEAIL